jgi:hypothetical protein
MIREKQKLAHFPNFEKARQDFPLMNDAALSRSPFGSAQDDIGRSLFLD